MSRWRSRAASKPGGALRLVPTVLIAGATAGLGAAATPDPLPAAAAALAGPADVVSPATGQPLRSGDSRTAFRIRLPSDAACAGDSAKAGYRIQSYLVPASADLAALSFAPGVGPSPVAGEQRAPLYEATFSADSFVDRMTAEAAPPGGPGPIIQPLPAFSFAAFDPAFGFPLRPGTFHAGIACTLGPPSATQQDRHWNTTITIAPDPDDAGPAKIRWIVTAPAGPGRGRGFERGTAAAIGATLSAAAGAALLLRRRRAAGARPTPRPVEETR
jgi:hypothetical protein